MRSIGRMLESLLAGLVPIRGRLIDSESVRLGGHELLVHRSILAQIPFDQLPENCPVFVVGVAQRDLFWKDIRRVLFSAAQYSVFCRLSVSGLTDQWRPVKLMDVLAEVHPLLGEQIGGLGETALHAMETAADAARIGPNRDDRERAVAARYLTLLEDHHGRRLDPGVAESILDKAGRHGGWLENVDSRRPVLGEMTRRFDEALGVETGKERACDLRVAALVDCDLGLGGELTPQVVSPMPRAGRPPAARFLDSEIVAIYW